MKNKVNIDVPDAILEQLDDSVFESTNYGNPEIQRVGPKVRATTGESKVQSSIDDVLSNTLKDGMTISFHHHFREGDFVFNKVMRKIIDMGYQNLTLAPSSLTNVMNDIVIEAIKKGVVTNITSSGMRGTLGDAVSRGILKNPVIFRSHGARARAIESGEIKIDVAFLGVPNSDEMGNANGMNGDAAFGSLGYALIDAQYADKLVLITDTIMPYPNTPASIKQTQVDYVVKVDKVGDPDKIGSGATRFTKDPRVFIPKKTTFRTIKQKDLEVIADKINRKPMRIALQGSTPYERFNKEYRNMERYKERYIKQKIKKYEQKLAEEINALKDVNLTDIDADKDVKVDIDDIS